MGGEVGVAFMWCLCAKEGHGNVNHIKAHVLNTVDMRRCAYVCEWMCVHVCHSVSFLYN